MALNWGASTDDVDHGSGSSLDDLDPFTWLIVCRPTAFTNNRRIAAKGGTNKMLHINGTGGDIRAFVNRATVNHSSIGSGVLTSGEWAFLAWVFDTAAGAGEITNLYHGTLAALMTEVSYGAVTDGSGAPNTEASANFVMGNNAAGASVGFEGDIAVGAILNVALTLGQIQSWHYRVRNLTNMVLYTHYGFNGTGSQVDWSGNGNSGTVGGTTVADHVPLGPAFGFDLGWRGEFAAAAVAGGLFRRSNLDGLGGGGPFFNDPLAA